MRAGYHIAACLWLVAFSGCAVLQVGEAQLHSRQRGSFVGAPPLQLAWTYNAGAGFGQNAAFVVGDNIMVATRNGNVHAISIASGRRLGVKSFGDALEAAPLLVGSTLHVPVDLGRRAIYRYNLSRSMVTARIRGAPVNVGLLAIDGGFVSVDTRGVVRRHHGEGIVWAHSLEASRFVHARPVLAGGHIILADDQGTVQAFRPEDGEVHWRTELGEPVYTSIAADAGRLYVPSTRGRLFSLEAATGDVVWAYSRADSTVRMATPAVEAGLVVFGATDGVVVALEASSGTTLWKWPAPDAVVAAPYVNAHAVYVGSMGGVVYALDRHSGEKRWEEVLRGRIKSDIIGHDDFLIILSEPRYVYLLRADNEDPL